MRITLRHADNNRTITTDTIFKQINYSSLSTKDSVTAFSFFCRNERCCEQPNVYHRSNDGHSSDYRDTMTNVVCCRSKEKSTSSTKRFSPHLKYLFCRQVYFDIYLEQCCHLSRVFDNLDSYDYVFLISRIKERSKKILNFLFQSLYYFCNLKLSKVVYKYIRSLQMIDMIRI